MTLPLWVIIGLALLATRDVIQAYDIDKMIEEQIKV